MAWFEEELPTEWPSAPTNANQTPPNNSTSFGDTSNSKLDEQMGTMNVQTGHSNSPPPWRDVVQDYDASSHQLTKMFVPPNFNSEPKANEPSDPSINNSEGNNSNTFSSSQSGTLDSLKLQSTSQSSSSQDSMSLPERKLKVFGNPDTFTNAKFNDLMKTVGTDKSNSNSANGQSKSTKTNDQDESDFDLANQLKNRGRDVLKGLNPPPQTSQPFTYETSLSGIPESSLDQLEQQLTSQDTRRPRSEPNTLESIAPVHNFSTSRSHSVSAPESAHLKNGPLSTDLDGSLSSLGADITNIQQTQNNNQTRSSAHSNSNLTSKVYPDSQFSTTEAETDMDPKAVANSTANFDMPTYAQRPVSSATTATANPGSMQSQNKLVLGQAFSHENFNSGVYSNRDMSTKAKRGDEAGGEPVKPLLERVFEASPVPNKHKLKDAHKILNWPHIGEQTSLHNVTFSMGNERLAQLIREKTDEADASQLQTLDLSLCDLETLSQLSDFCPKLTTLFLNDNRITSLQGLPKSVVHLDLSTNNLGMLNQFSTMFISTLILANNEFEDLTPLTNLRALSSLDLSNNKLKSLRGANKLTALRHLNVRENQLREVDLSLGMLCELDCAHNQIQALRLETPNLETLDLEENDLVRVNVEWSNLRMLNMRFNPAFVDLHQCSALEALVMDGCTGVSGLERAANNLITFSWEVPRVLAQQEVSLAPLAAVRDIKLSGWPLRLGDTAAAVQHLDLANCKLTELPNVAQFPFLKSLNLAFNQLGDDCVPLLLNTKLERLSLYGNNISKEASQQLLNIKSLRFLDTRRGSPLSAKAYATSSYLAIIADQQGTTKTSHKHLQWINGFHVDSKVKLRSTTRPGFSSAVYEGSESDENMDSQTTINSRATDLSSFNDSTTSQPLNFAQPTTNTALNVSFEPNLESIIRGLLFNVLT